MARSEDQVPPLPGDGMPSGNSHRDGAAHLFGGRRRTDPFPEDIEELRPAVEQALQLSTRRDRSVLSAALAPVVGGALRRAFWNTFKRAIVGLNRFLVLTFSADGLRWHFEALRSGKTFETVVREHSLVEPVTQVFLIHRRTGLLLAQVIQPATETQDGDMVSGMLTAIQDFVHDSFHVKAEEKLEVIRMGDMSVLIEQGASAILAGIISQGYEPQPLRETFRRALKQVHSEFAAELESFDGDVSLFEPACPILEHCLKLSMVKGDDRISPLTGLLLAVPVVAGLVFGSIYVEEAMRWHRYLAALNREPGIAVLETGRRGGSRYVRGLRDPLARDPSEMLIANGMTADEVRGEWTYYQSLEESLVLSRVRRLLDVPSTVHVRISDSVVVLDGTAPAGWKSNAICRLTAIQGVRQVRADALNEEGVEALRAWDRYVRLLEKTPGIAVLRQEQRGTQFFISGLRDPLAQDPDALLVTEGIPEASVIREWASYQALHPDLVLARAKRVLEPPSSVTLALAGGCLRFSGRAPNVWIRQTELMVRTLAGVDQTDFSALADVDLEALNALIPAVETPVFFYLADRQNMWPGQDHKLSEFLDSVRQFQRLSRRFEREYVIEIRGHAPASGDEDTARSASLAIADRFYNRLQQTGLDMERCVRRGLGGEVAPSVAAAEAKRRESHVSFHVREAD